MGPYESLDNIKELISKPLQNKTIRNTHAWDQLQNLGPDADKGSPDTGPWDEHKEEKKDKEGFGDEEY